MTGIIENIETSEPGEMRTCPPAFLLFGRQGRRFGHESGGGR